MSQRATGSRWVAALGAGLLLAGCATSAPSDSPSATPETTGSPTATAPDTATASPTAAPADVAAAFRKIADASCDRANAEGIVELAADGSQKSILIPKSMAYQDFNAAFYSEDEGASLIWSTENFGACIDSINFSLADEGGTTYKLDVTFNSADGTFTTSVDQGRNQKPFLSTYTVENGVLVSRHIDADWGQMDVDFVYGMPSDEDIAILHDAVDAFLAEN
jgi:hypothetical protein